LFSNLSDIGKIWVFSLLLVFFIQSIRLIIAILIANYYEYVSMIVLILLGFAVLIGPLLGLFATKNRITNSYLFLSAVLLLFIARIFSIFISSPSVQFFLSVLVGVTALFSLSYLFRLTSFSREEMIFGIIVVPLIDLLLKGISYSSDLIYYFNTIQFILLIAFSLALIYFVFKIIQHSEETTIQQENGSHSELLFGASLMIGFILFIKFFSTPGTIIFFIHKSYPVALLIYSFLTLVIFVLSRYIIFFVLNNQKQLYFVATISILFVVTIIPLIYFSGVSPWLLLMFYFFSYLFLILLISFSSIKIKSVNKFVVGLLIGLFLSLLLVVIQLLFAFPVLSLIYSLLVAFFAFHNCLYQRRNE